MKIKCSYETVIEIGTCRDCGETNLSTKYGDQLTEAGPVCYLCYVRLIATPHRGGASRGVGQTPHKEHNQ